MSPATGFPPQQFVARHAHEQGRNQGTWTCFLYTTRPTLKPRNCKTAFCFEGTLAEVLYCIYFPFYVEFQAGESEAAEQPYMAARLWGGSSALSSLHLFLTTQLLLSSPPPPRTDPHKIRSLSGLARERPPSTASIAWGSLAPSAPPKHLPCPSQAAAGLHLLISREKKSNISVTPF